MAAHTICWSERSLISLAMTIERSLHDTRLKDMTYQLTLLDDN